MLPKDFLKSKNISEPTYNGVRFVDNEMKAYKITDLLYEYAIITLKEANAAKELTSDDTSVCDHHWVNDIFDVYGCPIEKVCEICDARERI